LPAGLPPPAAKWTGLAKFSFVGGNNDPEQVPVDGLIAAVGAVLEREGKTLATDGPYAEAREGVGGFVLVDVANLDEAIKIAERIPGTRVGGVEIRPVKV